MELFISRIEVWLLIYFAHGMSSEARRSLIKILEEELERVANAQSGAIS
jgi:hypothetical protein